MNVDENGLPADRRQGEGEVRRPATEVWFNRLIRPLLALGLGGSDFALLIVAGRRTGKLMSVPVNVMQYRGEEYLISPRGAVQWVKNVRAAGSLTLKRGRRQRRVTAVEVPVEQRAGLLRGYLERYGKATGQYFPLAADASLEAFAEIADRYPSFRIC